MTDELITRLAAANPVPHDGPLHFAEPVRSRPTRKAALVAAVVGLALAGTGVAIANGLGAFNGGVFNGISAAHHPRTAADVIDPAMRAYMERKGCTQADGSPCAPMMVGMRFDTSSRIAQLPGGQDLYIFQTTWKGLCFVAGSPPQHGEFNCSSPLGRSHPSTAWFDSNSSDRSDWFMFGIAVDGVTSVSFESNGQDVTVPVKGNVWTYRSDDPGDNPRFPLTAHFADGGTVVDNCSSCLSRRILRRLGQPESQMPVP